MDLRLGAKEKGTKVGVGAGAEGAVSVVVSTSMASKLKLGITARDASA